MRLQLRPYLFFILILVSGFSFAQQAARLAPNCPGVPGACGYVPNQTVAPNSPNPTPQNGNGSLGQIYSFTKCGLNFSTASQRLGRRGSLAGVLQPAPFNIGGIPAGAVIEKAYLWAEGSGNGMAQTATVNGPLGPANYPMAIVGSGPDKCWGYAGSYTYRADVTPSVNGNGVYNISGILTNPPTAGNDMDGATLIVIWSDATQAYRGTMIISDGAVVINGGTTTQNVTYPAVCGATTGAQAFFCVGDIQFNPTSWSANGTPAPLSWNWWNYVQVATTVAVGQTTSPYTINTGGDCFNLCVAGLYYRTTCISCSACTLVLSAQTNVSCNGTCTGTATMTSTGTGPINYVWSPAAPSTTTGLTNTATGLCAGVYTCTATDALGCISTQTVLITQPPALAGTTSSVNSTCGNPNGSATVTPSGGTPPYTVLWTPSGQTTLTATGLLPGLYSVVITDSKGCTYTATVNVSNTGGPTLTIPTFTNVTCFGACNGTANSTITGGTAPFIYSWSPSGGNSANASGLCLGVYTCVVTDANSCSTNATVTITEPTAIAITTTQVDLLCNGVCNGSATATASGGTPGYSYLWSPSGGNAATATGLCAGNYSCLVTDLNGCTLTQTFTITEPTLLTVASAGFNVTCFGVCDGQVVVIPNGGTPNYTFLWNTGCTTPSCNNICAGNYNVTVTDQNGCSATSTTTVTEPTAISITTSTIAAHCNQADGSASCVISGGTGTLNPVWYMPATPGLNLNNISAGSYYVVVTDANGCDDTSNVVVNNIPGVVATAGPVTPVSCFGGNNGAANVSVAGGTGIITYAWSCSTSTTNSATGLVAGTCTVTVTDSAGCTSTANYTITQPTDLTITASAAPSTICLGQNSNLVAVAAGGTTAYSYAWLPGQLVGANQNVSPLATTTYSVIVVDANGCSDSTTVILNVNTNPVAILSGDSLAGCAPHCVNFTDNSTIAAGTITSWAWDFGDGSPVSTSQNPNHCYLNAGIYNVTLTVSTSTGCSGTIVMPNYIQAYVNPIAVFTASPQPTTELNPTIYFVDGSTNAATWDWSFGDLTNASSTQQNPTFTYPGNGCFDVILTVTTINGCIDTTLQQICIDPDVTLYVPNAFTPNGDGINEIFYPQQIGIDPEHFEMWVFDRWGNMIFYTSDLSKGWDGSVQGKGGDLAQQDTYVWKIKAKDLLGNKHNIIGHVSLIR